MRHLLFAFSILLPCALAGCVWPPDSTPTGYNPRLYVSYDIHRISRRSVSGVESTVTIVSPFSNRYTGVYTDSLLYIIVNGDTAFRHLSISSPFIYDSSAPYKLDGSVNFVTIVFHSTTIRDTSYVTGLTAQITSPIYGDTILRTNDALFGYTANSDTYNGAFQVTDSLIFYSQSIDIYNSGANNWTVIFPVNEMETFRAGTLWADLYVPGFVQTYDAYNDNVLERTVELDRIVAYPLR